MRTYLAIAAAGLAMAIWFVAPTAARADTIQGCNTLQNVGTEYDGYDDGGGGFYFSSGLVDSFCNVSISISGQFEIESSLEGGCLSLDTANGHIAVDSRAACEQDGGAGYPWDRWTAISIEYHSNQLWMLQSAEYPGYCVHADLPDGSTATADWVPCDSSDHYQWFSWNVGL
jgi:hypothetical protein